jgi:hypothetical protein
MRQDLQSRRIAELEVEIAQLRAELAESEKLRAAGQHPMLEFGLRLSQENEALRKELALTKNIGPRMNTNEHE